MESQVHLHVGDIPAIIFHFLFSRVRAMHGGPQNETNNLAPRILVFGFNLTRMCFSNDALNTHLLPSRVTGSRWRCEDTRRQQIKVDVLADKDLERCQS